MGNYSAPAALLLVFAAAAAQAQDLCFEEAGAKYGINPLILRSIAKVESNFNPRAINWNTNGTYDFGVMQINSIWERAIGRERWNTLGDPCSNIMTGAWILSNCMDKYGYSWKAIGCYHSQTPARRDRYAMMVFGQLQKIQRQEETAAREKKQTSPAPSPAPVKKAPAEGNPVVGTEEQVLLQVEETGDGAS